MKNGIYVLGLASLIFLLSCSTSDKNPELLGAWKLSEMIVDGEAIAGSQFDSPVLIFEDDQRYFIKMTKDITEKGDWSYESASKEITLKNDDSAEDESDQVLVITTLEGDQLITRAKSDDAMELTSVWVRLD